MSPKNLKRQIMPLFRFHRGQLKDSLKTTIIVKSEEELIKVIFYSQVDWNPLLKIEDIKIEIKPYPESNNFDSRIGWYTHMVYQKKPEPFIGVVGFLSEKLDK